MHMLHFHGFQRHDRLASRDALARSGQNCNDTPVHRGAYLAVAVGCRRRGRRRPCEIAGRKRNALAQNAKAIAVTEKSYRFGKASAADTNGLAAKLVDLEPVLRPIEARRISALALTHDLNIVDAMIQPNSGGKWQRRRQRPSAPPWRPERIRDVEQQCRQGCIRIRAIARGKQKGSVSSNEGRGGLPCCKFGMPQAGGKKCLIGRHAECYGLLEAVNKSAPRLVAGGAVADRVW